MSAAMVWRVPGARPGRNTPALKFLAEPEHAVLAISIVFMLSGNPGDCMHAYLIPVLACIMIVMSTGCLNQPAASAGNPPSVPATSLPGVPPASPTTILTTVPITVPATVSATPPGQGAECTLDSDCVPAECCHPTRCIPAPERTRVCTLMCTLNCVGPLDCGAGSCGCTGGKCAVVPLNKIPGSGPGNTAVTINVSPSVYSNLMSSTPGIGLEPGVTGFSTGNATFSWNASYGHFLSWNSPDSAVKEMGTSVANRSGELYWTFTDTPPDTTNPVIITVSAADIPSGSTLGSSRVVLAWLDNSTVKVSEIG